MTDEELEQRACALAWARGCDGTNDCWNDCVENARDQIREDDLTDWERSVATVERYRRHTEGGEQ